MSKMSNKILDINFGLDFIIDLHGKDSIEATNIVLNALYSFEFDSDFSYFDIVVGSGEGILKFVVSDLLDEQGYKYSYINKNGSVIRVFRKKDYKNSKN